MRTIIDGNSLLFRAYYGIHQRLTRPDGTPVNAVFGFCNMLLPFLADGGPDDEFICVFDAHRKNWRNDIYPEYKMNRIDTPPDLVVQFEIARDAARAMGMPVLSIENFEADDVIATLCQNSCPTRIISSDKDLTQLLIDPCVHIFDSMKNAQINEAAVIEKFGVKPAQMIDYQALVGDASDNVPGVCGIGPKKAAQLLSLWGSLDAVYENLDKITPDRVREFLITGHNNAFLSRDLVRLRTDVELPPFQKYKFNLDIAQKFFADVLGSRSLAEKARKIGGNAVSITPTLWVASNSQSESELSDIFFFNIDEYLGPLGISSIWDKLTDPGIKKIAYNWKKIFHQLNEMGFDIEKIYPIHDIMLMNYAANIADNDNEAWDCCSLRTAFETVIERLCNNTILGKVYEMDMDILRPLYYMEKAGVAIDLPALNKISNQLHARLDDITAKIYSISGSEFNISSPKQLAGVLFDKLGLPSDKKRSTDADVLGELAIDHEIAGLALEYRGAAKLVGTYTDALPKLVAADGRIHTTFLQTSTNTGRLSSRNPNMQNIPLRSTDGAEIRRCFVAAPGHLLISADYSQIQLRILAHIADIPSWKAAFAAGLDIHAQTAEKIFGYCNPEKRRIAKVINFSIIYGISSFGLASQLGINRGEAKKIIDDYMAALPEINGYIDDIKTQVANRGWVETLMGRRIYFPEYQNPMRRAFALRAAINAPVQGSEADIVRLAMAKLAKLPIKMILQVHDEILFECPAEESENMAREIKQIMESVYQISVPLIAECVISGCWEK